VSTTNLVFSLLVFVSVAGLVAFLFFDQIRGSRQAAFLEKALRRDSGRVDLSLQRVNDRTITEKNLEARLRGAGLKLTPQEFLTIVWSIPVIVCGVVWYSGGGPIFGAIAGGATSVAVPRFAVAYLHNRRKRLFGEMLPGAIDVIVRGAKAGLPVPECVRTIAAEASEPICSEFRQILQDQAVGRTVPEAFASLAQRINSQEAHLLSVVMTVQQQTGGNIAEILQSFSETIRARSAMKGRIAAITSESKASAYILSALPFFAYYQINSYYPERMALLFETTTGNLWLFAMASWMTIGVVVMFRMVDIKV
jgi:tight adherence protein B